MRRLAAAAATGGLAAASLLVPAGSTAAQIDRQWPPADQQPLMNPPNLAVETFPGYQMLASDDGKRITTAYVRSEQLGGSVLEARSSSDGGKTFGPATALGESPNTDELESVVMAGSADGKELLLAWNRFTPKAGVVATRSDDGGQSWSQVSRVRIGAKNTDGASQPRLAMSDDGQTVVLAVKKAGGGSQYFAWISLNGGLDWAEAEGVSGALDDAQSLAVGISGNGKVVAVGTAANRQGSTTTKKLEVQVGKYDDASKKFVFGAKEDLAKDEPAAPARGQAGGVRPQFELSDTGATIAVLWQQQKKASALDPTSLRPQVSMSTDSGATWAKPQDLSEPTRATTSRNQADLAMTPDGAKLVAAFADGEFAAGKPTGQAGDEVRTRISTDSGKTWSKFVSHRPQAIFDATGLVKSVDPSVAVTPDGANVLLAYNQSDKPTGSFKSSLATESGDGGATWGAVEPVSPGICWEFDLSDPANPGCAKFGSGAAPIAALSSDAKTALVGWVHDLKHRGPNAFGVAVGTEKATPTAPPTTAPPTTPPTTAPTTPPTPKPTTPPATAKKKAKVKVKAVKGKSKIKVKVGPDLGKSKQWKFQLQKKKGKKWVTLKKVYKTQGAKHTKVVDQPKGKYRVKVKKANGYKSATSKSVSLKK